MKRQEHESMAFLSGVFVEHTTWWIIVEKGAFAVVNSMSSLGYIPFLLKGRFQVSAETGTNMG